MDIRITTATLTTTAMTECSKVPLSLPGALSAYAVRAMMVRCSRFVANDSKQQSTTAPTTATNNGKMQHNWSFPSDSSTMTEAATTITTSDSDTMTTMSYSNINSNSMGNDHIR